MKPKTVLERDMFFTLLAAHTDRLVAGANAAVRLFACLDQEGIQSKQIAALVEEVNRNESSGDEIKADHQESEHEKRTSAGAEKAVIKTDAKRDDAAQDKHASR